MAMEPLAGLDLAGLTARVRPVALAGEQGLPVLPPLAPLLLGTGLRRGSTVAVQAAAGASGATSLALALVAAASQAGSWVAAVGLPGLGAEAAAELGVVLERFPQVPAPPARSWASVVAALVDAFAVVVVAPPGRRVAAADGRRLVARARERGAVIVQVGGAWPEVADATLRVERSEWEGLAQGHGHLRGRRVEVVAGGRRGAARERRAALWLPHPDGGVQPVGPVGTVVPVGTVGPVGRVRRLRS